MNAVRIEDLARAMADEAICGDSDYQSGLTLAVERIMIDAVPHACMCCGVPFEYHAADEHTLRDKMLNAIPSHGYCPGCAAVEFARMDAMEWYEAETFHRADDDWNGDDALNVFELALKWRQAGARLKRAGWEFPRGTFWRDNH